MRQYANKGVAFRKTARTLWCMVGTTTQGDISLALIGATLRRARTAKVPKMSVRELAKRAGIDHTRLSRIENGHIRPDTRLLAELCRLAGMTDSQIGELLADASQLDGVKWIVTGHIDPKVQMQALYTFEGRASAITGIFPLHIPGQLQTPAYTAAILRGSGMPEWEVEQRVAVRARRSQVLIRRNNPPLFTAYIGEEALHRPIGGPEVIAEQLYELFDWASPERPNIDIRVIPQEAGWYPGMGRGYTCLDLGERSIAVLEDFTTLQFRDNEADLAEYRRGVDSVRDVAMSPEDSRECIVAAAQRYEKSGSESVA